MADREQIKSLLKSEPYIIGHWLGFKDLTSLHNQWLLDWLYGSEDSTVLAHRESYKTSDLALFLVLNCILHPSENVIFIRKTDTDVAEVLRLVGRLLRTGAVQEIVKQLYQVPFSVVKETQNEIETSLHEGITGASQIVGFGIGGSLTGKHADVIVTDDIVNLRDRVSRAERERTKLVYQELQNVKKRSGRFINTGTPWHKDDAISMMPNVQRFDCYTTGLMTEAEVMEKRAKMSASLFSANYELKHIADEDAMFTDPDFTNDVSRIYGGICHIDAGYGGEDSTAFTVIAEDKGQLIVYGKKYERHVEDCLAEILRLKARYQAGTTWTERNADKGYLDKSLKEHGDVSQTYHERMNKHIKISTYLKENWSRVLFLEETDPEYLAEILDYNEHAPHDDCPDSLASAIRQLNKRPMRLNSVRGSI